MEHRRFTAEIMPIISSIKKILDELYGERLVKMILYGSFARDEATDDSDIDIAVVLKGCVDQFQEIRRINELTYPLVMETGELISFYPISETELADTQWPLHYHIQMEGIKV